LGFSDEHTVKRVFVQATQESGPDTMLSRNGEYLKTFAFYVTHEIGNKVTGAR
jgi:hypothetical protein